MQLLARILFASLLAAAALALLPGCARFANYERTYSVSYIDEQGRQAGASLHLKPIAGLAK